MRFVVVRAGSLNCDAVCSRKLTPTEPAPHVSTGSSVGLRKTEFGSFLSNITGWTLLDKDLLTRPLTEDRLVSLGGIPTQCATTCSRAAPRETLGSSLLGPAAATVDLSLRPRCDHIVVDNCLNGTTSLAEQARGLVARTR